MGQYFEIRLGDEVPAGYKMLAVGLVVAGKAGAVRIGAQGGIDAGELAKGIQEVTRQGHRALGEAQSRSKGIQLQTQFLRTYVPKR